MTTRRHGVRFLSAGLNRWLSPDPILNTYLDGEGNGGVYNSINLNLYAYAANNPVMFKDVDGRAWTLLGRFAIRYGGRAAAARYGGKIGKVATTIDVIFTLSDPSAVITQAMEGEIRKVLRKNKRMRTLYDIEDKLNLRGVKLNSGLVGDLRVIVRRGTSVRNSKSKLNSKTKFHSTIYKGLSSWKGLPAGWKSVQRKPNEIKNPGARRDIENTPQGKNGWKKYYHNGYDGRGNKISIHYFGHKDGSLFDPKTYNEWSG